MIERTFLVLLLGFVLTAPASAQVSESLVYNASKDGREQWGSHGLTQGSDGNLYGTAKGGTNAASANGYNGSIYKVSRCTGYPYRTLVPFSANEQTLHGLTEGPDGNLYGTTFSTQNTSASSNGTIFRVTKAGKLDVLHTFDGPGGKFPSGPVFVAKDGAMYGTTAQGGITGQNTNGFGVVYKLTSDGKFSVIYDFGTDAGNNGANPSGRLVQDTDGSFYGTARTGGANKAGAVFKITPSGEASVILSFGGGTSGSWPSDLLLGKDGKLYGKLHGGAGIVFALTLTGTLSTLHGFTAATDGAFMTWNNGNAATVEPAGTLLEATDGRLYGTTESAGPYDHGTLYRLNPEDGAFEVVYAFKGTSDGGTPIALVQAKDGALYGTALSGGSTTDYGGVFKLSLGSSGQLDACPSGAAEPAAGGGGAGGSSSMTSGVNSAGAAAGSGGEAGASDAAAAGTSSEAGKGGANGASGASGKSAMMAAQAGQGGKRSETMTNVDAGDEGDTADDKEEHEKESSCAVSALGAERGDVTSFGWLALALAATRARRRFGRHALGARITRL